jgi:hypothetical protein
MKLWSCSGLRPCEVPIRLSMALLMVSACASAPPVNPMPAPGAREAKEHRPSTPVQPSDITTKPSGTYETTDAVWLPRVPIAVNQDFDLATSMGVATIGPAVAAHARRSANEAKASTLASIGFSSSTTRQIQALRAANLTVYGLLWGPAESAILKVFVYAVSGSSDPQPVAVSDPRPIAGESGWTAPGALDGAFRSALEKWASGTAGTDSR